MKKINVFLVSVVMSLSLLAGCTGTKQETPAPGPSQEGSAEVLQVATSINPIDQLVKIIGGDRVNTLRMVPAGADAHTFEPTIKDMAGVAKVKILFINGLTLEPWAEKAAENSGNKSLRVSVLSEGVDLIHLDEDGHDDADEEDHDHEEAEGHNHGEYDPHVWLSLEALMVMAENIKDELVLASPENEKIFSDNLMTFKKEATALKEEYVEKFKPYAGKAFVTGHAAFGYLTRELGIVQKSVEGPFQEGEPTPKTLETLINFVKKEEIKTIFIEEQASPKVSETLARETGSQTVVINPLESDGGLLESLKENYDKILNSFE